MTKADTVREALAEYAEWDTNNRRPYEELDVILRKLAQNVPALLAEHEADLEQAFRDGYRRAEVVCHAEFRDGLVDVNAEAEALAAWRERKAAARKGER